ncbi:hypothetical protein Tco_0637657, partial [Tanacetum coccineum]
EEFVQSIQIFLIDKKNLATEARRKKKTLHLLIPNVRFTKLIIHHLRTKHNIHPRTGLPLYYSHEESVLNTLRFVRKDRREVFGMPIPDALLTDEITSAPYNSRYLEHVAEYQRYLDEEHGKAAEEDVTKSPKAAKATKSKTAKQTKPSATKASKVIKPLKPTPTTTKPSKKDQSKKRKLVKETSDAPSLLIDAFVDEGVPEQEPVYGDEEVYIQWAVELIIKEQAKYTQGPAHSMVIREPDSGRIQPLPDVHGKGKEKVSDEQVALDLLTLQTPKKKSPSETIYLQRAHITPTTEPSESCRISLLYMRKLGSDLTSSQAVHAGPNLEHMDFEVTNASIQQNPKQIDEEFTTTAYPSVQENLKLPTEDQVRLEEPTSSAGTLYSLQNLDKELSFTNQFLVEKSQEDEPDKSNTEAEVQSMVMVPIHQDTSSVPLMTTPVIDLTMSQPVSTTVQTPIPTSTTTITTITTTTSLPPPLPQPQQSTADPILVRRIGELEKHMADLLQDNLALGKAPLRARFRDLPTIDIKEILQQRMFEDDSYKANNVHNDLYEALQKSLELDYSNQRLAEQEEARKKRRKSASGAPDVENNWASVLASSYEPPAENSLLAKTGDMMTFLNRYCRQINKSKLTQADLEGQTYEVVKGSMPVLSISKMKAARYPDFSLELLVPEQIWIEDVISIIFLFIKRMLSTAVKLWTRNLVIRQRVEDFQLGIESYQTQLNLTKPGWDATGYEFKHDYTSLSLLEHFHNSDEYNHDPEKCEHVGLKVTTSHEGNNTTRMIWRFTMADDLKEMLQRSHKSKELMLKATTMGLKDLHNWYQSLGALDLGSQVEFHRCYEDLKNLAMCDFSYDALCAHWLSLKGVTLTEDVHAQFQGKADDHWIGYLEQYGGTRQAISFSRHAKIFPYPIAALKNAKYDKSAKDYQDTFEFFLSRMEVSEEHAISLYLGGLPTELEMAVRMFKPKTLSDAYCLTTLQEATLEAVKKKSDSLEIKQLEDLVLPVVMVVVINNHCYLCLLQMLLEGLNQTHLPENN